MSAPKDADEDMQQVGGNAPNPARQHTGPQRIQYQGGQYVLQPASQLPGQGHRAAQQDLQQQQQLQQQYQQQQQMLLQQQQLLQQQATQHRLLQQQALQQRMQHEQQQQQARAQQQVAATAAEVGLPMVVHPVSSMQSATSPTTVTSPTPRFGTVPATPSTPGMVIATPVASGATGARASPLPSSAVTVQLPSRLGVDAMSDAVRVPVPASARSEPATPATDVSEQKTKALPAIHLKYDMQRSFRDTLFGKVRYAVHRQTATRVVVKEYIKKFVAARTTTNGMPVAENALNEIQIHQALSKMKDFPKYVVKMLDLQQDDEKIYTVLEYCENGDFFGCMEKQQFETAVARVYTKQLLTGLYFLHAHNIVHRDMSLENLLMDGKQNLKICDFGVACEHKPGQIFRTTDPSRRPGKIRYMAPEVFSLQPYDPRAADIWSCGVIIFVMLIGSFPFQMPSASDDRFRCIFGGNLPVLLKQWGKAIDPGAMDLLQRMLSPADKRITMQQIVVHPWLNKV